MTDMLGGQSDTQVLIAEFEDHTIFQGLQLTMQCSTLADLGAVDRDEIAAFDILILPAEASLLGHSVLEYSRTPIIAIAESIHDAKLCADFQAQAFLVTCPGIETQLAATAAFVMEVTDGFAPSTRTLNPMRRVL